MVHNNATPFLYRDPIATGFNPTPDPLSLLVSALTSFVAPITSVSVLFLPSGCTSVRACAPSLGCVDVRACAPSLHSGLEV